MGKYCCFVDPERDYGEKELTDTCKQCGRQYNFPMLEYPSTITNPENNVEYRVCKSLGRGFYGVTYLCEKRARFSTTKTLLKVTPVIVYDYFKKNFDASCQKHAELTIGTEFLVSILDAFDVMIQFGDLKLDCHVCELEYVPGCTLEEYISNTENATPRNFAQIVMDILSIWNELKMKSSFHNDLHAGNLMIEDLPSTVRRINALSPHIRVRAIDLDSAADDSLSNEYRIGDQHHIAYHINMLADKLMSLNPDASSMSDHDYRLIDTLKKISSYLLADRQKVDLPNEAELIQMVQSEFSHSITYAPWENRLSLTQISEGLNAQTIHSCNIPKLLVDPDENWLKAITISGPQLIVGMRGCGKTMLLSALDIHARLEGEDAKESKLDKIGRINEDHYIGLKASCRHFLPTKDHTKPPIFEILFWLYAIEVIRSASHLRDISPDNLTPDYHIALAETLQAAFSIEIPRKEYLTDSIFEKYLFFESSKLFDDTRPYKLHLPPVQAFELLAQAYRNTSKLYENKSVFFLLDDASTRYLSETNIKELLRNLIFQNPYCAFKITTERQTLDLGITSPGKEEVANEFRDFKIFDLGAQVYSRTSSASTGRSFIAEILKKRIKYHPYHPPASPEKILGDCALQDIAKAIRGSRNTSKDRKSVYYGLSALAALCVGDIGDIITLYDLIIQKYQNTCPVSFADQTSCFQELCSRRMYNLESRNTSLQKYALSFAEANHTLLLKSDEKRLRQYTQLYVRITTKEREKQSRKIRELIDAGIFVFADSGTPRTKTRDTNPTLQFKLAFRKLFGLSNYIALSDRDRFELSGEDLEEWLVNPSKEILCRKLGVREDIGEGDTSEEQKSEADRPLLSKMESVTGSIQLNFLPEFNSPPSTDDSDICCAINSYPEQYNRIQVERVNEIDDFAQGNGIVLITGLGFEECSYISTKRILEQIHVKEAVLLKYSEPGYSDKILEELQKTVSQDKIHIFDETEVNEFQRAIGERIDEQFIVDITAMSKPIIFSCIRKLILESIRFLCVHTEAQEYFPLEISISEALGRVSTTNSDAFIHLMNEIYTGEHGPYSLVGLMNINRQLSVRPSALIGILSAKNQRIFKLLDTLQFEQVILMCNNDESYAAKLAILAGQIAQTNYENTSFKESDLSCSNDYIKALVDTYYTLVCDGMDVDLALTGSAKLHAAICAAFSTQFRIRQCWYVKPNAYDASFFSRGYSTTQYFRIHTGNL